MLNGADAVHGGCSAFLVDLYVPFGVAGCSYRSDKNKDVLRSLSMSFM
jgi:hypothetical protein